MHSLRAIGAAVWEELVAIQTKLGALRAGSVFWVCGSILARFILLCECVIGSPYSSTS